MVLLKGQTIKSVLAVILAAAFATVALSGCNKTNTGNTNIENPEAKDEIKLPENEEKKEEIIINDNYADSELYGFEGTIDEIYDDGSMLVYSPSFGVNFDYMVIVEKDATTKTPSFEPKVNQQIKFNVYSAVKRSKPLTVVAYEMEFVKEESTQRAEEEARKQKVQENLEKFLEGQNDNK